MSTSTTVSTNNKTPLGFDQYCIEQKNHDNQINHHLKQINNNKEQILDKIETTRETVLSKLSKDDIVNCQKLCKVDNKLINYPPRSWGRIIGEISLVAIGALLIAGSAVMVFNGITTISALYALPRLDAVYQVFAAVMYSALGVFGVGAGCATPIPLSLSMVRGVYLLKQAYLQKSLGKEKIELYNQLVQLSVDQAKYKGYILKSKNIIPKSQFEHKTSYLISEGSVYFKPAGKKL